jgi:hypothetical protein
MAELIFRQNIHDEYMYDMLLKTKPKEKVLIQLLASIHCDSLGDMGADNYVPKSKEKEGYYVAEVTAEIIF